ncbi:35350_t:CDS:2, partial [Gigaspora margarita]
MSKKQKITTPESNIQYENELTEGSFETTDNTIDLTESTSTEPTVELTNTSEENNDWLVVNSLIQLLEPFFIATEILSTSTYPTISDVRLTIIGLLRHLESFLETYPDTNLDECMVANSINFKLQEYWEYVDEPTTIGALLDPRSKTKTFKDINKRDRAIALLQIVEMVDIANRVDMAYRVYRVN